MKEHSTYHKVLRVSVAVFAVALVFDSGIASKVTSELADDTRLYMANSIGVSIGVEPTPLNQYTAKLTTKQTELDAREVALNEREISINLNESGAPDTSTYFLSSILFILLVLILLNYTLDYLRYKESQLPKTV